MGSIASIQTLTFIHPDLNKFSLIQGLTYSVLLGLRDHRGRTIVVVLSTRGKTAALPPLYDDISTKSALGFLPCYSLQIVDIYKEKNDTKLIAPLYQSQM